MDNDLVYKIALTKIKGVGHITAKLLLAHCGDAKSVFEASIKELSHIAGIGPHIAQIVYESIPEELANDDLKYLRLHPEVKAIFYTDETYPRRLKHHDSSPILLYHDGTADLNMHRTVAIIGTRNATEYGTIQCEKLVEGLSEYGVQIVSGLAYGIDSCAHRAAVQQGINNIAVLGSGIDKIYPAAHNNLAKKIKSNGAVLSQFAFGSKPDRANFPIRNQVVAAISDAVIVIESKKSGGSMITAHLANDMNKDVFALPGKTTDSYSEGCNNLIKQHKAHLLQSAADIAYIMRWDPQEKVEAQMKLFEELEPSEKAVINALNNKESIHIDSLHAKLQKPLSLLSADLLSLEFKGLVKSLPGKRYMRM